VYNCIIYNIKGTPHEKDYSSDIHNFAKSKLFQNVEQKSIN